jgi:Holliday junction DNA helicase RuvA
MLAYLKGKIILKNLHSAVVVANDIGYEVFLSAKNLDAVKKNDEAEFYTHEYLREDSRELYGFMSVAEMNFFRQLISVSSVGPKMAMNIMSIAALDDLRAAVNNGNLSLLTSGSGVGTKTAQKIILELRGKLVGKDAAPDNDVVNALVGLGYSKDHAAEAYTAIPKDHEKTEDKIRAALKYLGKK